MTPLLWTLAFAQALFVCGVLAQAGLAALCGMRVEVISFGYGRPLMRAGRWQIASFPLGGFVRVAGLRGTEAPVDSGDARAFFNRNFVGRVLVVLGWSLGAQVALLGFNVVLTLATGEEREAEGVVIRDVTPESPADSAGLRVEDILLTADGDSLTPEKLRAHAQRSAGGPMTLEVERGGERRTVAVRAAESNGRYVLGVQIMRRTERVNLGVAEAFAAGASRAFAREKTVAGALFAAATAGPIEAEVVGPVGIVSAVGSEPNRAFEVLGTVGCSSSAGARAGGAAPCRRSMPASNPGTATACRSPSSRAPCRSSSSTSPPESWRS